jgi:hypothetical protein
MYVLRLQINWRQCFIQHENTLLKRTNIKAIKQHEAGDKADDICCEMGVFLESFTTGGANM